MARLEHAPPKQIVGPKLAAEDGGRLAPSVAYEKIAAHALIHDAACRWRDRVGAGISWNTDRYAAASTSRLQGSGSGQPQPGMGRRVLGTARLEVSVARRSLVTPSASRGVLAAT